MGKKLNRHAHDDRDYRSGKFRKSPACDGCGKPVGTNYFTDEDVCGGGDGPGFYLCDRVRCCQRRDLDVEGRRALYTAQRAINDAADRPALRSDTASDDVPDAECTGCGKRFWSADGHPTLALCKACWHGAA